jgi:hypothetical protein
MFYLLFQHIGFTFSCLGYFTFVSPLGVLVDMHNWYLSFCFLARNIKFICLFRPSKSALLQGELAKLMCCTMVSCFLAQSYSKNLVFCRYMASICGFIRWGMLHFFLQHPSMLACRCVAATSCCLIFQLCAW